MTSEEGQTVDGAVFTESKDIGDRHKAGGHSTPQGEQAFENAIDNSRDSKRAIGLGSLLLEEEKVQPDEGKVLSKRERKRLLKTERFLLHRKDRRKEERERRKNRRAEMRAQGHEPPLKRRKWNSMADSSCKLRLVIDMSFDALMTEKDRRRCLSQLTYCYAANRKQEQPVQYHVVGFDGETRKLFAANSMYANWDVALKRELLEDCMQKQDIVYLTADSKNVLSELDESKAYIIGGLVDHNSHKGICLETAEKKGWSHARLPIDEFVKMNSRKVLTINHVFEILLLFWKEKDWEKAFFNVIPKRKGAEKMENEASVRSLDVADLESKLEAEEIESREERGGRRERPIDFASEVKNETDQRKEVETS